MLNFFSVLTFIVLVFGMRLSAQEYANNYSGGLHYGFIIPHSEAVVPVADSYPYGAHFEYSRLFLSEKYWQNSNCFYRSGFSLSWFSFDNPKELGHTLNLRVFFEPLIRPSGRFYTSVKFGSGLAWISKVYDEKCNPRNYFFSLPVSFPLYVSISAFYKVNKSWEPMLEITYNHISNGGIRLPNKGMNYPTVGLGLRYNPVHKYPGGYRPQDDKVGNFRYTAQLFASLKVLADDSIHGQEICIMGGPLFRGEYFIFPRIALSLGTDLMYDGYAEKKNRRFGIDNATTMRWSLLAGIGYYAGRFSFSPQLAWFLFAPESHKNLLFQRYDINFQLARYVSVGAYMSARLQVADIMGLSLAYTF